MATAKARARRVRVPKRTARKPGVTRGPTHRQVWSRLGTSVEKAVGAFESGKDPNGALKSLDISLMQIARMPVPKNLKPDQIHNRITIIRTCLNLRDVERRINALVVAKQINMKQRGELMRRVHRANELREQLTIKLASVSPSDAARPSFAAMGPDLIPTEKMRDRVPGSLKAAYRWWNKKPWPGEEKKAKAA